MPSWLISSFANTFLQRVNCCELSCFKSKSAFNSDSAVTTDAAGSGAGDGITVGLDSAAGAGAVGTSAEVAPHPMDLEGGANNIKFWEGPPTDPQRFFRENNYNCGRCMKNKLHVCYGLERGLIKRGQPVMEPQKRLEQKCFVETFIQ